MPRKTTIKILNKCESSSQTRNTNLSCLKLNWKKRSNNKTLEKVRSNKIEGCGHFTIKWLTVIFDRLSGLISRIIREIKILFDNSLIVSGVSLSEVKIGEICLARNQITFGKTRQTLLRYYLFES